MSYERQTDRQRKCLTLQPRLALNSEQFIILRVLNYGHTPPHPDDKFIYNTDVKKKNILRFLN